MSKLIYFMPMSLDGFIAGETGNYEWSDASHDGLRADLASG